MGDKQTQNYNAGIPSMGGTNVFKRIQAELNTTQVFTNNNIWRSFKLHKLF